VRGRLVEAATIIGMRGHSTVFRACARGPRRGPPGRGTRRGPRPRDVEVRGERPRWAARRSLRSFSSSRNTQACRVRARQEESRVASRMTWTFSSPCRRVEISARIASSRSRSLTAWYRARSAMNPPSRSLSASLAPPLSSSHNSLIRGELCGSSKPFHAELERSCCAAIRPEQGARLGDLIFAALWCEGLAVGAATASQGAGSR